MEAATISTSTDAERWLRVKQRLRAELGDDIFSSWFAGMQLDRIEDNMVRMSVPTPFLKSWIGRHYSAPLLAGWQAEREGVRLVIIQVRSMVLRTIAAAVKPPARVVGPVASATVDKTSPHIGSKRAGCQSFGGSLLDPRFTFANFFVGRSNTFAHAASTQVIATKPGVAFNALYLYAGVGLGKTHLLQAIAQEVNGASGRRVLYLTAERFMYGFVSALKTLGAADFKETLRGIDVLAIDDLQFLRGKSTQEELSRILGVLLDAGRQVVVAGDRPLDDLEVLDDRVRSRLAGGLVVKIGSHEEELRLLILKSHIDALCQYHPNLDVPEPVLKFIVEAARNGRDLDGVLNRLLAHNKLNGHSVTMEMAERAVCDLARPQDPKPVKFEDMQRVVAKHYNVSRDDIMSRRRTANVVRARQIAMYLAKVLMLRSLPEIGRRFGGRDHTTVLYAVNKIKTLVGQDPALAEIIELIKKTLLQE